MLALNQIAEVAQEVAHARFGVTQVEDVRVEPVADWTGADALRVLIVLQPSGVALLENGRTVSRMLNDLGNRLDNMGEERFAYVDYATRAELEADDDPES